MSDIEEANKALDKENIEYYVSYQDYLLIKGIKHIMADEFKKLIGEDTYDERDDHDTLRRQLRQKIEEWKK